MPSTLIGQLTSISLMLGIIVILVKAKRGYDKDKAEQAEQRARKDAEEKEHRAWLEQLWIEHCRKIGYPVSRDLILKHMQINGNANLSSEEKDRVYGTDRPRSPHSSGVHQLPGHKDNK